MGKTFRRGLAFVGAIALLAILTLYSGQPIQGGPIDFRQAMRDFVTTISAEAKRIDPSFIIIPQNGQEIITTDGEPDGPLATSYAAAIDGFGREDVFYGYEDDNVATPAVERDHLLEFLERYEAEGIEAMVTDYCFTPAFVDASFSNNESLGHVSFAADDRELRGIPPRPAAPFNENDDDITTLGEVKNFLYLLNPSEFKTRESYLNTLATTNFDLLLIDPFVFEFSAGTQLTAKEVASLKTKANGGARLVIAYMSIGEAEDFRHYWKPSYDTDPPPWIADENPNFPGDFKVRYWMMEWQDIIVGEKDSFLTLLLDAGFDGTYLDIIDAFEFFEDEGEGGAGCSATTTSGAMPEGDLAIVSIAVILLGVCFRHPRGKSVLCQRAVD